MTAWYIDAFDARAGLGFASRRQAGAAAKGDSPAVFFKSPDFAAVQVSNRALGLSGSRFSFQEGLFLEQQEVPFPSLDDVVEFARRCYVAGGGTGGGGGDGNEPGPNVPEPDDGGDGPRFLKEEDKHVREHVSQFENAIGELRLGESKNFRWKLSSISPDSLGDILLRGALAVAWEALRRLAGSPPMVFAWDSGAGAPVRDTYWVIWRLGLWDRVRYEFDHRGIWQNLPGELRDATRHAPEFFEVYRREHVIELGDSVDVLDLLPLPWELAPLFASEDWRMGVSLSDLLTRYVAAPHLLANTDVFAVVLFAAVVIVADPLRPTFDWRWPPDYAHHTALEAARWLDQQLPGRAFSGSVEALISATASSKLRYVTAEGERHP